MVIKKLIKKLALDNYFNLSYNNYPLLKKAIRSLE